MPTRALLRPSIAPHHSPIIAPYKSGIAPWLWRICWSFRYAPASFPLRTGIYPLEGWKRCWKRGW